MPALPSSYKDDDDDGGAITDINITPFVDVVLVLLVIFIVTAKLLARGIDIDKPKEQAGGDVASLLRVSVDRNGVIYVNGEHLADDAATIARIRQVVAHEAKPKAIIAGDRKAAYEGVMHAMALVHDAGITSLALENERPK
jgi:biopolymer transport protein TolR